MTVIRIQERCWDKSVGGMESRYKKQYKNGLLNGKAYYWDANGKIERIEPYPQRTAQRYARPNTTPMEKSRHESTWSTVSAVAQKAKCTGRKTPPKVASTV